MDRNDWIALVTTIGVHALLLLITVGVVTAIDEEPPEPELLVEVDFTSASALPVRLGPPQRAEAGPSSQADQQAEPERPAPPASTPVRVPERESTPNRSEETVPRPRTDEQATPERPNPPSRTRDPEPDPTPPRNSPPTEGGGNASGESDRAGTDEGRAEGSGGNAEVEVGFNFGNRSFNCPSPPSSAPQGQVVYRITFAPNGSFVRAIPVRRNAALENVMDPLLRRCRADRLPSQADQVNQATQASFVVR